MSPAESGSASIGKSVEIRGEVKGSEDLVVDGHVEGTITLTDSRLTIGPTARVDADVSARDVIILGVLNGNVHAVVKVDLRKGAHLSGDIRAARLSIEEGSIFCGKVDLTVQAGASAPVPIKGVVLPPVSASGSAAAAPAVSGVLFTPAKP